MGKTHPTLLGCIVYNCRTHSVIYCAMTRNIPWRESHLLRWRSRTFDLYVFVRSGRGMWGPLLWYARSMDPWQKQFKTKLLRNPAESRILVIIAKNSRARAAPQAFRSEATKLDALTAPLEGKCADCTDSRDRGTDGLSSEEFPSYARSAFVRTAIVRSSSHGEVPCHRPWTFPFVSQDLKSSQETPIMTIELPDKMYPTILCKAKCPMIRPQRYMTHR